MWGWPLPYNCGKSGKTLTISVRKYIFQQIKNGPIKKDVVGFSCAKYYRIYMFGDLDIRLQTTSTKIYTYTKLFNATPMNVV